DAFGVDVGAFEARVRPRLDGRDHGELRRAVEAPCLDPLDDLGRLDGRGGRDLHRHLLCPVVLEPPYAGTTGQQCLPGRGDIAADGSRHTEAGDNDARGTHLDFTSWIGCGRPGSGRLATVWAATTKPLARMRCASAVLGVLDVGDGVADGLEVLDL